jgi:hypothetical protein
MRLEEDGDVEVDGKRRRAGVDHEISMTTTETQKIVLDRFSPNDAGERSFIVEL